MPAAPADVLLNQHNAFYTKMQIVSSSKNKKASHFHERLLMFVGVARFELTTSCSQSRRDTGLRYTPNFLKNF
jgi:hypothetical protein